MPNLTFDESNHRYAYDDKPVPNVTGLLKRFGMYAGLKYATDEDMWRGQSVHEALRLYHKNTLNWDALDPDILPYIRAWESFVQDTGFTVWGWEVPMGDDDLIFAGKPDVWGECRGELWLPDYKTGPIQRVTGIQLAAYEHLLKKNNKFPPDRPVKRIGVQLKPDGKYNTKPFDDPTDINIWLMMVSLYNWGQNNVR